MLEADTVSILYNLPGGCPLSSIAISFSVVFPIVMLIAVGCLTRVLHWVSADAYRQMNKLVFHILLPCLIFSNISNAKIEEAMSIRLTLFGVIGVTICFLIGIFIAKAATKDPRKRGVVLQSIFRSNFILYGLLIVQALYGDKTAVTSLLVAFVVPLFNILAVISLEIFRGGKINVPDILLNMLKNPLIVATVVACLFNSAGLSLPVIILQPLGDLAKVATPMALIVLGGTFEWQSIRENRRLLILTTGLKLFVWPVIFLSIAIAMGFRDVELLTLAALFGSPAAVSSFSMAQQMGGDFEFTSQNVLFTTVLSFFTVFLMIAILSHFTLI